MSYQKNSHQTEDGHINEVLQDILGSIMYNMTDPRNLLDLLKSIAMGMPIAIMIGMLPRIAQVLFEKIPAFFEDKKAGDDFIKYCEKRAEELKKIPEIRDALKTKNVKKIISAIKNNMNDEDRRVHQSAIRGGFQKQIDPEDFTDNADISSRQRDDAFGDLPNLSSKSNDDDAGIFPTLASSLTNDDEEEKRKAEDLPVGDFAIAEHYVNEADLINIEENLHKWFKEKWVRFGPDGKIRGQCAREKSSEGKPKCRPLKSAQAMGKKGRAKAARRKRREDPNPDRSGKAKNVKTEEIMNENHVCPICGGELVSEVLMNEKKDACYYKVKSRYKVWPSAYASGALVKCRKKGAKNWGTKSEGVEEINEKWSEEYKRSINCNNPKGFSQRAHCQGRKKTEEQIMKEEQLKKLIRETIEELYNEEQVQQDECWECYEAAMEEGVNEAYEECYKKTNWEMVPEGEEHTCEGDEFYEIYGDINADSKKNLEEAEYRGRKVPLGKPMRGDVKKFKVFVRNPQTGKVKKVNFGDKKMRIKKSNPKRRKSFRARHNCANPGPRTKARYWSCRKW